MILRVGKLLLLLSIGLSATYVLQLRAADTARATLSERFASRSRQIVERVEQRLEAHRLMLTGARAMFQTKFKPDRRIFADYVAGLQLTRNYPGIQAMAYAPLLPAVDKAKHVAALRKQGFSTYSVRPDSDAPWFAPVEFIEPFAGRNPRQFGFDLLSDVMYQQAMDSARDASEIKITGKISLVQDDGHSVQAGFLMFAPVFGDETTAEDGALRQAPLLGWVYATLRMDQLLGDILGDQAGRIALEVFDGDNESLEALLYDHDGVFYRHQFDSARYRVSQRIDAFGRGWILKMNSLPAFEADFDGERVTTVRVAGVSISLLSSLLLWQLLYGRVKSRDMARELGVIATAFESQEGMFITDPERTILRVNKAFSQITGYAAEEVTGQKPDLFKSNRHDADFYAILSDTLHRTGSWEGELWSRRKNGEAFPAQVTITAVKGADDAVTHYVATFNDITDKKNVSDEIERMAFYDPLTGLPNRRCLQDRLRSALVSGHRTRRHGALLFIDMDNFKQLNDSLGHDMGDLLLQQVAERLSNCVREDDTIARLGGDEFVVMLEDLSDQAFEAATQAEVIGHKILAALNQPFQLGAHEYRSTPSIGASLFNGHEQSSKKLLKQADIAMYQVKASGRNAMRFFDPQMQAGIAVRMALEQDLRQALAGNQLELVYQPQFDVERRIVGAEALLRWHHPLHGVLAPADFIALAEESGLMPSIGQWLLETACTQLKLWQSSELSRDLRLSVNISVRQFRQPEFVEQVLQILDRSVIEPGRLTLELPDMPAIADADDTAGKLAILSNCGVRFALDRFGVKPLSLPILKQLALHQLKIDPCLVTDIDSHADHGTLVKAIVNLAENLGVEVLAQGVDTEAQRICLLHLGCRLYQGYLFGKPLPLRDFERLLASA